MFEELWRDDRAIEGLPIRLVIALVVGVASMSVIMGMIPEPGVLTVSELDVDPQKEVIGPGETEMNLTVLDAKGQPVSGATVVVKSGTATLDGTAAVTATTGPHGNASVRIDPTLSHNQEEGTITIDVKPPATGGYSDRRGNTEILVVAGHE